MCGSLIDDGRSSPSHIDGWSHQHERFSAIICVVVLLKDFDDVVDTQQLVFVGV